LGGGREGGSDRERGQSPPTKSHSLPVLLPPCALRESTMSFDSVRGSATRENLNGGVQGRSHQPQRVGQVSDACGRGREHLKRRISFKVVCLRRFASLKSLEAECDENCPRTPFPPNAIADDPACARAYTHVCLRALTHMNTFSIDTHMIAS
jgi:hypothetical protein